MTNNWSPVPLFLETGNTQAFDAQDLILLRAGRNLDDCIAFQGGDFNLSSEDGCDELNRDVTEDIVPSGVGISRGA